MINNHNQILEYAYEIGNLLRENFPAVRHESQTDDTYQQCIPHEHVPEIAEEVTLVVAHIIQAWLDAGSERDVTMEELGPEIEKHFFGWSSKS